ncbi:hypothetical protein TEQG_08760, partial [Trichophyton equinum CBS 127.97]
GWKCPLGLHVWRLTTSGLQSLGIPGRRDLRESGQKPAKDEGQEKPHPWTCVCILMRRGDWRPPPSAPHELQTPPQTPPFCLPVYQTSPLMDEEEKEGGCEV